MVNTRNSYEEKSPWSIERISAAVAIDGIWKWKYDDKGKVLLNPDGSIQREYIACGRGRPRKKPQTLVEHAIGYNRERGTGYRTAPTIRPERSVQRKTKYRSRPGCGRCCSTASSASELSHCILRIPFISREIERRRKLREEELARQHQAMREAALRSAEEEGVEVEMSVEERARLEMQENAINMAREHPEDVAQLIRTWLMEE